nr:gtp-binding protein typa/bipa like [Quercus suber]
MMERDFYLGRILTGRVSSGIIRVGDRVHGLRNKDSGVVKIEEAKVVKLMKKKGTAIVPIDSAGAGDIISMAGLASPSIGHTVANVEAFIQTEALIMQSFFSYLKPLKLTGGRIGDRLMAEAETNLAINVSMGYGTITAHALMSLEARGTLFVTPGMETYDGMIVGEHSRDTDLDINPSRAKELTNVRAASKDENVKLSPPRLMTLEEAIGYVASDELIEVTPKAIRLRKKYLDVNKRKTLSKRPKE